MRTLKLRAARHMASVALVARMKAADKDKPDDDDEDEDEDDAKAKAKHSATMKAGAEKFRAAADKYEAAAETDSASALMGAESAGDEATEHHVDGKASCMRMRGAEPADDAPDSDRPPAEPPKADARAVAAASGTTSAKAHAELAHYATLGRAVAARSGETSAEKVLALAALGRVTMAALGTTDVAAALVDVPRKLKAADGAPAVTAERDDLRRARAWDAAIPATFSAGEVWTQTEANGKRAKAYSPMARAMNDAYPDVAALEARLASLPKLARAGASSDRADADIANAVDAARGAVGLSPRMLMLAKKAGVDPQRLAARTAENLAAISGQES